MEDDQKDGDIEPKAHVCGHFDFPICLSHMFGVPDLCWNHARFLTIARAVVVDVVVAMVAAMVAAIAFRHRSQVAEVIPLSQHLGLQCRRSLGLRSLGLWFLGLRYQVL